MRGESLCSRVPWRVGAACAVWLVVMTATARADASGRDGVDGQANGVRSGARTCAAGAVRDSHDMGEPRAAATAAPPAIVKILRRSGHPREQRGCGWSKTGVDASPGATGLGSRGTSAAMVANAADIVRLCRWQL